MASKPHFQFVATLGVHAKAHQARQLLGEVLGLSEVSSDAHHVAFASDRTAIFVDTTESSVDLPGFTPLFACDEIDLAQRHLEANGCKVSPMPWNGPGLLVEGPGGLRFCVAQMQKTAAAAAVIPLDPPAPTSSPTISPAAPDIAADEWDDLETALAEHHNVDSLETLAAEDVEDVPESAAPDAASSELETRAVSQEEIAAVMAKMESEEAEANTSAPRRDAGEAPTEVVSRAALASVLRAAGFELHPSPGGEGLPSRRILNQGHLQPPSAELEATGIRFAPTPQHGGPSIVDAPHDAVPYSEFEIGDTTQMGAPSNSLLDRAGGSPDVTQLGAPPPGLLNRLARGGDVDDDSLARQPPPRTASKRAAKPSLPSASFADDDDNDRTAHAAPPPEFLQDELLIAERRRMLAERQAQTRKQIAQREHLQQQQERLRADREKSRSDERLRTEPAVALDERDNKNRRRPRSAGEQVQSAAENVISRAAQLPAAVLEFDDDTARESPRALGVSPTEAPDSREAPRPRRVPTSAPPGPMLFGDDEETAVPPSPIATEAIGQVFTETNDDGSDA